MEAPTLRKLALKIPHGYLSKDASLVDCNLPVGDKTSLEFRKYCAIFKYYPGHRMRNPWGLELEKWFVLKNALSTAYNHVPWFQF